MVLVRSKPRYSEQIENGVLYFAAPGRVHRGNMGSEVGMSCFDQQEKLV